MYDLSIIDMSNKYLTFYLKLSGDIVTLRLCLKIIPRKDAKSQNL